MELRDFKNNRNIIQSVLPGSIAWEMELEPGDELLSINGSKVRDIIDYKFLINDEIIILEVMKKDKMVWELEIEKDFSEDLGIDFSNPLIDHAKTCNNKCIFCFIDQLPPNMRETLYFKDDDSRLSFLQGNFITLTNMKEEEINRMIKYKITPVNISVHTTNPELRTTLLGNRHAGKIMDYLHRFYEAGLEVQCQIVLIPEFNDKSELMNTLKDLSGLYPTVTSIAIVPVGLTKYREKLEELRSFTKQELKETIQMVENLQNEYIKQFGTRLVFLSDEFYLKAGKDLPLEIEYEGYPQIENGVGMVRSFWEEFLDGIQQLTVMSKKETEITFITGKLSYELMERIGKTIHDKFPFITIVTEQIVNSFFGNEITVSGLLTATDIFEQLKDIKSDVIMIPRNMMKNDELITLDDFTIEEIQLRYNRPVICGSWDGYEFIETIRQVIEHE